jgi:hypothetical protein
MYMRWTPSALLAAALLAAPGTADAQLGRIIKQKAQERVAGKAAEKAKPAPEAPKHHAERYTEATIGTELDETTLNAALRGLLAVQGEYAGVVEERIRVQARASELSPSAGVQDSVWRERRQTVEDCQQAYLNDYMEKRQLQMTRAAMRPSQNQDTIRLMMALNDSLMAAQQRGDSVALQRLTDRANFLATGIDASAARREAAKKCGELPERPAVAVEHERLREKLHSLFERERAIQIETSSKATAASGLPAQRFALARERLLTWVEDRAAGDTSRWSPRERALLERRHAEIRRALGYPN